MKKLRISKILVLCLFIFSFGILENYNAKSDTGPEVTVSPEYPKEQIRKSNNLNVLFNPNQHYDLTLAINNTSNENKKVTISPNNAYTTNNGNIAFDNPKIINDSSIKYNFRSLFEQKEHKIIVPPNSSSKVNFRLKMPPKKYKGIILGGFYINIQNDNKTNIKNNVEVKNNFSYGLATIIHSNKEKAQPKVKLGKIATNNNDSKMQVQNNIRNIDTGIISGMNIKSEVIKNNNNTVVSKSNHNNLSMAPNSSFNYEDTIDNSLSPGKYTVKFNITDDSGHIWQENKGFKITTQKYITHFTQKIPWTLYTLIGIIIILALIIILLAYHQFSNKNKNNNQSKTNSQDKT